MLFRQIEIYRSTQLIPAQTQVSIETIIEQSFDAHGFNSFHYLFLTCRKTNNQAHSVN